MSVTCHHVSPGLWHCWSKICQCQMLPTPWLDSWLGHVSADVSLHDCPAISRTHQAITPMEVMVAFDKKIFYSYINAYDIIFTTFLHQITPLQCYFCEALLKNKAQLYILHIIVFLHAKMPTKWYYKRRLVLESPMFIPNFHTDLGESNQFNTLFDPEYKWYETLEGYEWSSQYYLSPAYFNSDNDDSAWDLGQM